MADLTQPSWNELPNDRLSALQTLLLDLDGVMYRGNTSLPGAQEILPALAEMGIKHAFVTNNSTLTPESVAEKLNQMSVPALPSQVVTSSGATADYLLTLEPAGSRVLVVGEDGLRSALRNAGFELADESVSCVAVGLDRTLTYDRLARACVALHAGARFIATNADPGLPVEGGLWWPGAGAIVAALRTASGRDPDIVGKPFPTLLRVAMARLGAEPSTTAIAGDQLQSDISAGFAAGITTILVGSDQWVGSDGPSPDIRVPDLLALVNLLRKSRA
ncbi:MAG: HAD-IIA family hydrolase [Chloroflexi bacterium]|nr:HAD-IIA family hydrolase [Chloroflexota bacterium]